MSGTAIRTKGNAENKPNKTLMGSTFLREETVNKQLNVIMPSTDYCSKENESRVRVLESAGGHGFSNFM